MLGIDTVGSNGAIRVNAFRFTPGQGWDTEVAARYFNASISRTRVAWVGAGGQAVAIYYNPTVGRLKTVVYANGGWFLSRAIRRTPEAFFLEAGTAVSGEVLLVIKLDDVAVTWLRP